MVPSLIGLRPDAGPDKKEFLPLFSFDTVEGSAHGNNPENRTRKTSRKNSHMISESGLWRATVLLPLLFLGRLHISPSTATPVVERRCSLNQCAEQCRATSAARHIHAALSSLQQTDTPESAGEMRVRGTVGRRDGRVGGQRMSTFPVCSQWLNAVKVAQPEIYHSA